MHRDHIDRLPDALQHVPTNRYSASPKESRDDVIAAEVPVALVFNGISHAVMMCTPRDLEEFALGFALSEGLIDGMSDWMGAEVSTTAVADSGAHADEDRGAPTASCEVNIEISSRCFARLKEKRRALAGRTGCGICGIDSLQALDLVPEVVTARDWAASIDSTTILRAIDAMPAMQIINAESGSVHAAGWARPDGTLTDLMEDVGRHNALDKLIGMRAIQGRHDEEGFVVMSSRASYELVRKCARMNIPLLATISAPTSLAVDIACKAGMQLWGLCRTPRAIQYAAVRR